MDNHSYITNQDIIVLLCQCLKESVLPCDLDVFWWNRKVGSLETYEERYTERICFYFDRDFLDSGYDIAPLRPPSIVFPSGTGEQTDDGFH